jgi:purine/pyrimidine-nucleoside phosphorylase
MSSVPSQFNGVSVVSKANVYFDGNVVSYTVLLPDGSKKTLGLIRPGSYHFNTDAAERMEMVDGTCLVRVDGTSDTVSYSTGTHFDVPKKSGFSIEVQSGLCQYICSFLT